MVETEVGHRPVETTEVVPAHREEPHPVQPIDSDQGSALGDHALDRPHAREVVPVQRHWEELHASEDHYCVEAHEEAAVGPECYAADRRDWPDTPDSDATLHDRTCTRAPCPCFESPEWFG